MTSSNRFWPLVWLAGILVLAYLVTSLISPLNPLPYFLLITIIIVGVFGLRAYSHVDSQEIDRGYTVIYKDAMGKLHHETGDHYWQIPLVRSIKAIMPNYPIRYEDEIHMIQTRTFRLARLEKVRVRVNYKIINHINCYSNLGPMMADRIKQLEQSDRLKLDDTRLWLKIIGEALHHRIDDCVRDEIWAWAGNLEQDDRLSLETPFPAPPGAEYDPYGLSLNRVKLAQKVRDEINRVVGRYGLQVDHIVFELIEVNYEFLKMRTQTRDYEISKATHLAALEAVAIREKGFAEAEVRARNLALLLNELINERGLSIKDALVAEIVRASLYSDGEMIWKGVIEKSAGSGPTKAA
jgi:hypothetical protein